MAAQDAELKLKVSLDLAFFRQQLAGLGQAAAGYNMPVQVQFKKESIVSQFRLLTSYLGRKTFDVKITSRTLEGLAGKVETLHRQLQALKDEKIDLDVNINASVPKFGRDQAKKIRAQIRRDVLSEGGQIPLDTKLNLPNVATFVKNLSKQAQIVVGLKNGATGKEVQNVLDAIQGRIEANQKIKQGGGKLRVPVSVKPGINNEDIATFKAAVQSKLGGITVKIKAELEGGFAAGKTGLAGLQEYMRTQGMSGGNMPGGVEIGRRAQFESLIGSASHADLKRYMKIAEIPGRSALTTKAQMHEALLKANDIAMESILGNMKMQMRDPLPIKRGFLDQVARAVFWMAGVDPEYLKQQAAQRKALPAVNFPASVPVQNLSIGPSGTGRALPPGAIPSALPGTAFGGQKYLPTGLGEETKKVLRDAANAFLDAIGQGIREVKVQDMGNAVSRQPLLSGRLPAGLLPGRTAQANVLELNNILAGAIREYFKAVAKEIAGGPRAAISRQPLLGPGSQVAGLLPAAGGTTSRGQMRFNAVSGGAILGRPQFMRAPSIPAPIGGGGGGMQPPSRGGGGSMGGFGGFGRALGELNLPGTGAIKGLGSEFAFATKQVLLFGQAYKLLGFIQDFPGQIAQAVAELQSFRNTLLSVTGNAQNAADANEFILAVVEKYNVPLEAARNGFAKLYASMAPAGFGGGEIQNLFLGISKAAATFGLSADKVDRVNYAFAQMASKGQIMSEELKGQLGDVLPGAMAIFAKAAGFEGPDAITKFSKALEDGVYKGNEMHKLLRNVGIEMNKEFGPGAEGAAKTFQGAINRLQNAFKGLYESFEPAAIGVLNSVMLPVVSTLKALTDGVNAYFKGQQASTPAAQEFTNVLQTLVPILNGIGENLKTVFVQLGPLAKGLGAIILGIGQILALPLVGQLAATYAQVLILTTAFNALATSGIAVATLATARFIGQGIVYAQVTLGMRVATQQTTVAMMQFGTTMQTVMIRSIVGVALVAISALIGRIVELRGQLAAIAGDSKAMEDLAKSSAKLGDIGGTKEAVSNIQNRLNTYKKLREELAKGTSAGGGSMFSDRGAITAGTVISEWAAKKLVEIGAINASALKKTSNGYKVLEGDLNEVNLKIDENIKQWTKAGQKGEDYINQSIRQNKKLKEQMPGLTGASIDEKALKAQQKALEDARKAADDKRKYEADLMKIGAQQAIDLDEMQFEHWKNLQQAKYDFLEAGQNEWMSREIKFQRDLQAIEIRRIEAIRKARVDTLKAETEMQAKAYIAGQDITGTTGLLQGSTGISSGPHFDVRRADGGRITEAEARALFDASVRQRLQMTSGYGPRNTGIPGASTFHRGIDLAGPSDTPLNLAPGYSLKGVGLEGGLGYAASVLGPQGQMYKVGHLQKPQAGLSPARMRTEAKQDYAANLAGQEAINAKEKESLQTKYANIQAQLEINNLIKEYVASIAPVEPQRLENTLLKNRIDLMSSGVFGEALDMEQKISEARNKAALGMQTANKQIEENNRLAEANNITKEEAARLNAIESDRINQLNQQLNEYIPLLRERLSLEQQSAEAGLAGQIQRAAPLGGMGLAGGFIGESAAKFEEALGRGATVQTATKYAELQNQLTLLEERNKAVQQSILGIGDAFGSAMTSGVASLVDGTATAKQVFADFLKSVSQALLQAAGQMISTYVAIGIAKIFAGLGGGGGGNPAGSGGGISNLDWGSINTYGAGLQGFANGGVAKGGFVPFRAFANGGTVSGPTLGLIGEGKYNEAVVPLPDGRSIPVSMKGGRSARDVMGNNAPGMPQAPTLNMKFETTRINGVEYVSKEQLEQAMAETRRSAIAGGARQGMELTLDRIKQSPSTRARVGIR